MNLKQAKITLEKINSLHKSMSMEEGNVSSIERDLMLSYIKQLYESFLNNSAAPLQEATAVQQEQVPRVKRNYKPPRIIEIPDSLQGGNQQKPKPQPQQPQPVPKPQPQPNPEPEPRPEPPRPEPQPKPTRGNTTSNSSMAPLFEFKEAKELSEKLSARPVQDLTKALAINDRLLYMNELFGKELNALNDALGQLNRYDDMDEARGLLEDMAQRYNWMEEEKLPIAKDFIQLVRRRYI